ncbi:MBL fold metallo-hydrolase [Candidatus Woesearchaeota archaeon]|nr:MBL fold metallo-hydrolase [Candidatus Woesearchaeota archaeon]
MKVLNINNVKLKWLGQSSFKLEYGDLKIYIDPYQLSEEDKADIILITHGHYDHCSIADIAKLTKAETKIITTPDTTSKLASKVEGGNPILIKPGDKLELKKEDILVEAVPAYNTNKAFHPKDNQWVGYILTINKVRFYHSGDSDAIPEMNTIKADIVMLPVGGTYTMNAGEAAKIVNIIKPRIAIPMHYGKIVGSKTDAERFKELCQCEVRILD